MKIWLLNLQCPLLLVFEVDTDNTSLLTPKDALELIALRLVVAVISWPLGTFQLTDSGKAGLESTEHSPGLGHNLKHQISIPGVTATIEAMKDQ